MHYGNTTLMIFIKTIEMKEIVCNECGKFLFKTERENAGAIGAEAQAKGFVYKNACLFSDKYSSLYFCDHGCGKAFYQKNIPRDQQVTKALDEIKKDIPRMANDVADKMARLTSTIIQ